MSDTRRILAQDAFISNDTRATGINNNDLIIGPSGAGKTRGYVQPNLLQCSGSMVIADTKGSLIGTFGPHLRRCGYRVIHVDFTDTLHSDGYNPLDYIRYDSRRGQFLEQDINTLCAALVPLGDERDRFWQESARMLLACLVGYVLDVLPPEEHTLEYVVKLFTAQDPCGAGQPRRVFHQLLRELAQERPDCFAARQYQLYSVLQGTERTDASVQAFVSRALSPLSYDGPVRMYSAPDRIHFQTLGQEKTAVFLTISDTDRSMDGLVNLFYTQALQALCASADRDYPNHRLPVPVRLILDDFATNACIPDFDKIISVIRSREISVSIILQSISQLDSIYGHSASMTIINNCDNCLYLGGQDVETARYIAAKANKTADTILNMPLDQAYLFTRGQKGRLVRKFDIRTHPDYPALAADAPAASARMRRPLRKPAPVPPVPEGDGRVPDPE